MGSSPRQLIVDDFRELALWYGAIDKDSVDKEPGCPVHADAADLGFIFLDIRLVFLRREARLELLIIQFQVARIVDERVLLKA